jgi:hypothetical protein
MENENNCNCPICRQQFTLAEGTTLQEHLVLGMLKLYSEMQIAPDNDGLPCPRCGIERMRSELTANAVSRYYPIYICNECDIDEAMYEYAKTTKPLLDWNVVASILAPPPYPNEECDRFIPEIGSAYPLCDNRDCDKSSICQLSAHLADDGGYSQYDK